MASPTDFQIDVHVDAGGTLATMAEEVRRGLLATPKFLPSKYFYDERGSRLFERITELPEYYLTRAEIGLLQERADEIARRVRPGELIELGSGSAVKTRLLIEAGRRAASLRRYTALEVSIEIAETAARDMARRYPDLDVHAVIGDFENHLDEIPGGSRRLVAFLGSTLGNFPKQQAVNFLTDVRGLVGDDGWLLLGTDLVKGKAVIEAAYNDSQGVTAEFNRNILSAINNQLDADFDSTEFEHVSYFNEKLEQIESYLRSRKDQDVRVGALDLVVAFRRGEMIGTEVSCKYTRDSLERILGAAGYTLEHWFSDGDYALSLARLSVKR